MIWVVVVLGWVSVVVGDWFVLICFEFVYISGVFMIFYDIVIVGGGVFGLYCVLCLVDVGYCFFVLEVVVDCWGGCIEIEDMDGFIVEYGLMCFELML